MTDKMVKEVLKIKDNLETKGITIGKPELNNICKDIIKKYKKEL